MADPAHRPVLPEFRTPQPEWQLSERRQGWPAWPRKQPRGRYFAYSTSSGGCRRFLGTFSCSLRSRLVRCGASERCFWVLPCDRHIIGFLPVGEPRGHFEVTVTVTPLLVGFESSCGDAV